MAIVIPQVITEDRASGGQVIDGSLKFDKSKNQYLKRTPSSAGNRKTWTISLWAKRTILDTQFHTFMSVGTSDGDEDTICFQDNEIRYRYSSGSDLETTDKFRDGGSWYHIVIAADTTIASPSTDRIKYYVNGRRITSFSSSTQPTQDFQFRVNNNQEHAIGKFLRYASGDFDGYMSQYYFVDGQQLDASYFGFTDPLTNTWRPKKYTGTYGTNGFYLPLDGNSPIGEDKSGNRNNWTPVNFGGSNTIEKATGALPILNTDGGGKVARVGVRTDSYASSLVLALPLVGIKSDVSNRINSGSTTKTITANGNAAASSTQSNFYGGSYYFDGTGDYLSIPNNTDFAMSTGDFTAECWIYTTSYNNAEGGYSERIFDSNTGQLGMYVTSDGSGTIGGLVAGSDHRGNGKPKLNGWSHVALTRSGSTVRIFLDGVLDSSFTNSGSVASSGSFLVGARGSGSGGFIGYIQDFRVYKGVAKYTSNFIPASTDPDILPDTPSGVAYSSALTKVTDGAVAFDGSGDSLVLTDDGGLNFGSGDFTLECFINTNNISGERHYPIIQKGNTAINNSYDWRLYFNDTVSGTSHLWFDAACSGTSVNMGSGSFANMSTNRWYHAAVTRESGTFRVFLDGVLQGSDSSTTNAIDNDYTGVEIGFNDLGGAGDSYLDGFVSNVRVIKGTALYTSNFTPPTRALTNVTNTTLLCCQSTTSATAAAVSPGAITANGGAAATNFNPFTTDINTVRGQESGYCTLNPISSRAAISLSNGNLNTPSNQDNKANNGTIGVSSGKWYWEVTVNNNSSYCPYIGVTFYSYENNPDVSPAINADTRRSVIRLANAFLYKNYTGTSIATGSTNQGTTGTVGVALNFDTGEIKYYKENILFHTDSTIPTTGTTLFPYLGLTNSGLGGWNSTSLNFGQKPFKYAPPEGFKTLCLANLPRPTKAAVRPDKYFKTVLWTGTGVTNRITGVGFKPDLVWIKKRNPSEQHELQDSVRGATQRLTPDVNNSETTVAGSISSFNSDGFTVVDAGSTNENTYTYVGWSWKAGGPIGVGRSFMINDVGYATAADAGMNTGTITPTSASVNTDAGISIVTYTGNGSSSSGVTIGHGLGVKPDFIITKKRSSGTTDYGWSCWHKDIGGNYGIWLDLSNARNTSMWGGYTNISATLFSPPDLLYGNENGQTYVNYLWYGVPGFSKFGTYTGNGDPDGVYVHLGFRPAVVIVKDLAANNWNIVDNTRDPYNYAYTNILFPDLPNEENTGANKYWDFLSNGLKARGISSGMNGSSRNYIYAAWAEAPTQNLFGGQANAR